MPVYAMNTDRDIWGDDALVQFKCVLSLISLPFKQTLRMGRRDDRLVCREKDCHWGIANLLGRY
jgi:hypothetical protein